MTKLKVNFELPDGTVKQVEAEAGENLLEIAHHNKVALEGACECSLACSTCHVVVDSKWFDKLDEACDGEEDMLDYAFGLTHTSRLGCQIVMREELDGIQIKIPAETRNMQLEKMQK